ncbi:SDR family NAD(P)-dependent oxidoreductase [Pseudonocardia kujensis]|uniref:SDR family NAD(P)-dependent oxidoreductase n=1 Tax=Pseudonocardia kujensis TaxID=1128675 RepID=UPI001E2C0F73|nr:SDR family NAD(P)-dependent oxidoreductase [Pseudonocardia kujensis]MCE0767679.1 SDR family NAD(P)-dependent oxidoreductase [Pseudonocardia kujensis]
MSENTIALVTGANKGLGRETVRRLAALGWTVLLGSRDAGRGAATAAELAAEGRVEVLAIDVTSDESVQTAAKEVEERFGRLDVLVNNAGIVGPRVEVPETGADAMREVFETNVFGPVRVTRAFLPLLERAEAPRIVMVSSGLGSLAITADPERVESRIHSLTYPSSKSALNMVTTQYAKALPRFRVNAADPGYTATDLNGHSGPQTVTEGTDAIVALAQVGPDGPTGTYRDRAGEIPW